MIARAASYPEMSPLPFGEQSRTGFELELLAPPDKSRRDLADAVARRVGGAVRFGLKYQSEGRHSDGRPVCDLSPAYAVHDDEGALVCTLVDDVTVRAGLDERAPTPRGLYRVVCDDVRLALWTESRCWGSDPAPEALLAPLYETFEADLGAPGERGAGHAAHRVVWDPYGQALAVVALYGGERHRVCEVVTAPLARAARERTVALLLEEAAALGFEVPAEAALHVHLDAAPWRPAHRLRRLILDLAAARELLWQELRPNPRCTRLGPLAPALVDVARAGAHLDDDALARALDAAGATKYADVNLLGLVRERPRHRTLELRCLPMSLDAGEVLESLHKVEELLLDVARAADEALGRSEVL